MASAQAVSGIGITSRIGDENLNSIVQLATRKSTNIAALLKKPLGESDNNTQEPTPSRTPSPPSRNLAKLDTNKPRETADTLPEYYTTNNCSTPCSSDVLPYVQYRDRQKRNTRVDKEAVWDEKLEKAFMEAIRVVPIIGRQKYPNSEGKLSGRNELISDHIYMATGIRRCRKQVSSHIQVLKKLLKQNKEFMRLVRSESKSSWKTDDESCDNTQKKNLGRKVILPASEQQLSPSDFSGSPTESEFHFHHPVQILYSQTGKPKICEVTPIRFGIWAKFKNDCSVGEPWSMFSGGFHTYTELPEDHSPGKAVSLSNLTNWESRFPYLEEVMRDGFALTTVIHLRCSLALITNFPIETSMLGSILEISHMDATPGTKWECVTRIYAPGKQVWKLTEEVFLSEGTTKLQLPFASKFWAAIFTELNRGGRSNSGQEFSTARRMRQEKESRAALAGITVIQELFMKPNADYGYKLRRALILTDFTKAEQDQPGIAQWREIIPPLPTSNISLSSPPSPMVSPTAVMAYEESFGSMINNLSISQNQYLFTTNAPQNCFVPAIVDGASYSASCSPTFDTGHHGFPQMPSQNYFQSYVGIGLQTNAPGSSASSSSQPGIPDSKNYDPAFSTDLNDASAGELYSSGVWMSDEVPVLHSN